jgi:hypothetical protein
MRFFSLMIADESRWHLDLSSDEAPLNIWLCQPIQVPHEITLHIFQEGRRVDYDQVSFAIPVVSGRLAQILEKIARDDIQRLPAIVKEDQGEWEVLNILACVDCIDHERSLITYYPSNHPEKPGKPRGVMKLVLNPTRAGTHHIFRPRDWEIAVVVSDPLRAAMAEIGVSGVEFVPVTEGETVAGTD